MNKLNFLGSGSGKGTAGQIMSQRLGIEAAPYVPVDSDINTPVPNALIHNRMALSPQGRMIRDKRKSFDKACLYSYQGALIKRPAAAPEDKTARCLINPNRVKQDFDEKILSVGYEHGFKVGDVFEWIGTGTKWLIYLQDLTELAYFRGNVRRCSHEISWVDEDGNNHTTYGVITGPQERKISTEIHHEISIDSPNFTLHILLPYEDGIDKYFTRYTKFYLKGNSTCWRVAALDNISVPGIVEVDAVEYYANEQEDDVENGIVGGLIAEPVTPEPPALIDICGETFIKPQIEYTYEYTGNILFGDWEYDSRLPIQVTRMEDNHKIKIKWLPLSAGSFELKFNDCTKTIVA